MTSGQLVELTAQFKRRSISKAAVQELLAHHGDPYAKYERFADTAHGRVLATRVAAIWNDHTRGRGRDAADLFDPFLTLALQKRFALRPAVPDLEERCRYSMFWLPGGIRRVVPATPTQILEWIDQQAAFIHEVNERSIGNTLAGLDQRWDEEGWSHDDLHQLDALEIAMYQHLHPAFGNRWADDANAHDPFYGFLSIPFVSVLRALKIGVDLITDRAAPQYVRLLKLFLTLTLDGNCPIGVDHAGDLLVLCGDE